MSQLGCWGGGNKSQQQKRDPWGLGEREAKGTAWGRGQALFLRGKAPKIIFLFVVFLATSPFLFLSLFFPFYLFILPGMY